jgi:transposase
MEEVFTCCVGLDVHKESIEACVRRIELNGRLHQETRHWGSMTEDLLAMADWMTAQGVTHVAMESTGVFWKPIFNILEDRFTVLLVNAHHIKQVPGRKSDVRDCQWIAQLLQHGLLKGSFIPPRFQRDLRDLTRYRTQLANERVRTVNRIHKVLEDGNIKLSSVATDLRFMLKLLSKQLAEQEALIDELDRKIEEQTRPLSAEIDRLDSIPGIDRRVAEVVLAEVGANMEPFPSHKNLASWAGMCPGNEESAGKRQRRRITPGNRWLKRTLAQACWAASHVKNTYLASQYRRLASRRGRKRALIAVGHSMLVIIYHMLKTGTEYADLRADFFDHLEPKRLTRYYMARLEHLGYRVTLQACSATA